MPAFQSIRIVADDLSGAADCAAAFASTCGPVPVFLDAAAMRGDCCALDTDSRAMAAGPAVAATVAAFRRIAGSGQGQPLIYKKIDSTLRGHVGAELAAALDALPGCAGVIVAPAFPDQGRTLVGGRLRVQGRPAEQLGHSGDLLAMLQSAGLPTALLTPDGGPSELAARIATAVAGGARAVVADALVPDDLQRVAAALALPAAPRLLVAGSAGLAKALAARFEPRQHDAGAAGVQPRGGGVLVVVGSFSQAAAAQVAQVAAAGDAQVLRLTASQWTDERHAALRHDAVERARRELAGGRHVLCAIAGEVVQPFSRALVQAIAAVVAPLVREATTCVLTGGDTARAVFTQLREQRIDVGGEFEPGIALGRAPSHPGLRFILKAGAFGDPLLLQRLIRHFAQPLAAPVNAS